VPESLLTDKFQRNLSYLRVSITDRCNLNCLYCRPSGCTARLAHEEILTYEEILSILRIAIRLGITKVRITGGEPLVRLDACQFIRDAAALPGIRDISLTTNGVLLTQHLDELQAAGIKRLNISLDTLDPHKFYRITGKDAFAQVWEGITAALEAGFAPVKLNVVVMYGINDSEISDLAALTLDRPLHVRFIEYMPTADDHAAEIRQILTPRIKQHLEKDLGPLAPLAATDAGGTAERFRIQGGRGEIGFISPVSKHFCRTCNRLRLTADGRFKPCLLSDKTRDIKTPLRAGKPEEELIHLFRQAVLDKPGYNDDSARSALSLPQTMSAIGG